MGMLCGTLDATFGDATVNGYSITTNRTMARRNLGICMQQDIIWDDVNIEDHLILFGGLRGLHGKALRDDVDRMIESLGFPEKRHSLAGTLSGGQKRRLCVGLSMVGGNSVVYLDEPTAGLDPVSRRQLWELVQRNRAGRAILLTTHFMDEADVLGDRIAIVKEGRLRAIGSSTFLKQRFGLGYLLRMSLMEGTNANNIMERVQTFVSDATVASSAGTELSVRMTKDAVTRFPSLFETLETENRILGVLSFGIETTTLEEVFMRIVNEDNETLLTNHKEANQLLGAGFEERESFRKKIEARDNARNPLLEQQMQDLLAKGRSPGASQYAVFFPQLLVLLTKRFHQFTRSKGQWSLGLFVPLIVSVILGALISSMPTDILADQSSNIDTTYVEAFQVPIAGNPQTVAETWADLAFGAAGTTYVGPNYATVYDYIQQPYHTSTDAVAYTSINNATILFNASYPQNFVGAVTNVLNAAVQNATSNLLKITVHANQLPMNLLGEQANDALMAALLFSLFAGSMGAAMSIVISGERVLNVKHQQLASGASKLAYWSANFIFDSLLFFIQLLVLVAILAAFMSDFSGSNYWTLIGLGIPYLIATIFRFYAMSFLVADIRMAQTIFFYGSLFVMFIVITLLFVIIFTSSNGNIGSPAGTFMSAILTIFEPTLAYFLFAMFTNNFLAVQTLNGGKSVAQIAYLVVLFLIIICIPLYFLALCYFDGMFSFRLCGGQTFKKGNNDGLLEAESEQKFSIDSNAKGEARIVPDTPSIRNMGSKDPDVKDEKRRVGAIFNSRTINPEKNSIFIHNLKKIYYGRGTVPTKVAVNNVSVSIAHGEVFGLLGANGAGKVIVLYVYLSCVYVYLSTIYTYYCYLNLYSCASFYCCDIDYFT